MRLEYEGAIPLDSCRLPFGIDLEIDVERDRRTEPHASGSPVVEQPTGVAALGPTGRPLEPTFDAK